MIAKFLPKWTVVMALAAICAPLVATQASAQDQPVILIVNQAALLANSEAGQDISRQINDLQQVVQGELQTEIVAITTEVEDLQKQRDLVSEEVFRERARELAIRERSFPAFREIKLRELQASQQQAFAHIGRELQPILQAIVEERGATILLDRSAVMYANPGNDITEDVLSRLDAKIQNVAVERVVLTQQQGDQN